MIRRFLAMGLLAGAFCLGLPQLGQAGPWRCHSTHYYTPCCYSYYVQPCYYRYIDCCGNVYYYPIAYMPADGTVIAESNATGNGEASTGDSEPVSAEEQKWFEELSKGKTGADLTKIDKLWKEMDHKERKEFYADIQKAKNEAGADQPQEPVTPEEQKWFGELAQGKTGEDLTKIDKLWKEMDHKERKEFYDEIQQAKKGGG